VEHEAKQDDSEIVIINTCGFIDNADAKKEGKVDKVYV